MKFSENRYGSGRIYPCDCSQVDPIYQFKLSSKTPWVWKVNERISSLPLPAGYSEPSVLLTEWHVVSHLKSTTHSLPYSFTTSKICTPISRRKNKLVPEEPENQTRRLPKWSLKWISWFLRTGECEVEAGGTSVLTWSKAVSQEEGYEDAQNQTYWYQNTTDVGSTVHVYGTSWK